MSTNPPQNSTSVVEEAAPGGARREKLQDDHPEAAATVARTPSTNKTTSIKPQGDGETEEQIFSQALQELKDFRSQLHSAARHCESAFLENKEKRGMVLESTKRYVCVAIVAVVDHLGSLSSKLEKRILDGGEIVETQHKNMDCLKQRLITCQQYAVSIEFSSLRCSNNSPRHHHYYAYPCPLIPVDGKPSELSRNKASDLDESDSPEKIDQFVLALHCPVDNDVICGVPTTDSPTKFDTAVLVHGVPILGNSSLPFEPFQTVYGSKHEDNYFVGIGDKKKEKENEKERVQANRFLSFLRVNRIRI